jgi:hypothetical protein
MKFAQSRRRIIALGIAGALAIGAVGSGFRTGGAQGGAGEASNSGR